MVLSWYPFLAIGIRSVCRVDNRDKLIGNKAEFAQQGIKLGKAYSLPLPPGGIPGKFRFYLPVIGAKNGKDCGEKFPSDAVGKDAVVAHHPEVVVGDMVDEEFNKFLSGKIQALAFLCFMLNEGKEHAFSIVVKDA